MRSLVLLQERHVGVNEGERVIAHAEDSATSTAYLGLLCETEGELRIAQLDSGAKAHSTLATLPLFGEDGEQVTIMDMQFLADTEMLCVTLSGGDINLISSRGHVEVIGTIDDGIRAAGWSSDNELVVFVTGKGNYVEMTRDFDVLCERAIETTAAGEDVQVTVGWGKKETQFHGSEGKQAAQRKTAQQATLSDDDDRAPRVSWRGDSSYFCISSVDTATQRRVIRVYNRDGVLQSTSEAVDKLEHALSWRPSGNLIASSQRLPHRHDIVMFERNGLRHGEFALRTANLRVADMTWSADSAVLAVWTVSPGNAHAVQLWYMNNYYWYLKQEITFEQTPVTSVRWHAEHPLHLRVSTDVAYYEYEFTWDVLTSPATHLPHATAVAVIDGCSVLYTPFRYANVPPPMSLHKLTASADRAVKCVAFAGDGPDIEDFATLSGWSGTHVDIWHVAVSATAAGKNKLAAPVLAASFSVPTSLTLRQLQFYDSQTLLALGYSYEKGVDSLMRIRLTKDRKLDGHEEIVLPYTAHRLYCNRHLNDIVIESSTGDVHKAAVSDADAGANIHELEHVDSLPTLCDWIATTRIGPLQSTEFALLALNSRSRLYLNGSLLSSECTSFNIHSHFLILTTFTHTARFLPLALPSSAFRLIDNVDSKADESLRRVERGSKVVVSTPFESMLVLQMPRGNLETVYPRALVLDTVRSLLQQLDYRTSFLLCRKHRIDLNILVDDDTDRFMSNVPLFIKQVPEVDYLNLFLSSLRNEDVTHTMYPGIAHTVAAPRPGMLQDKVNRICDAVRGELQSLDIKTYVNTIITTYVRKTPPELEDALRNIKDLKRISPDLADAAVKYTVFLVKVDALYDVALGMYDFGLVLMVAQHSHKDPREYLPFLTELKKLPKYYQQFRVDDHLKRYTKALDNLSQAGEEHWDECAQYIKKHALYQSAIRIYRREPERLKSVADMHGEHLLHAGQLKEAAIAFHLAENYTQAMSAYRRAGMWREVFSLAEQTHMAEDEVARLAQGMAKELHERTEYSAAAQVLFDYAHDIERAMTEWLRGGCWSEAVRVAQHNHRLDLIATHVKPGVVQGHKAMLATMQELHDDYEQRYERLVACRREKEERSRAEMERLGKDERLDDIDVMSDTTSMMSTFTGLTLATATMSTRSGRSSRSSGKARRKEERKRHAGKKGSIYEEAYLVDSCRRLTERANQLVPDVAALTQALMQFAYVDEAQAVQTRYEQLLLHMRERVPVIFVAPKQTALERLTEQYRTQQQTGEGEGETVDGGGSLATTTDYSWPTMAEGATWKSKLLS
ncbi:putative elongator complex protein 1 [Sorochytrium milnesiophthora]